MIALSKWSAKRVGAGITIEGVDAESGRPLKVTKIGTIQSASPYPIARGCVKGFDGPQQVALRP